MEKNEIYELLKQIQAGDISPEDAMNDIRLKPDMLVGNYANIDLHRHIRQGMPEVIYGESKTAEQIVGIARAMQERGIENIMVTRVSGEKAEEIQEEIRKSSSSGEEQLSEDAAEVFKEGKISGNMAEVSCEKSDHLSEKEQESLCMDYLPIPRIGIFNRRQMESIGKIVVVAAGTSDLPVAEEAAVTAELYGNHVERIYDVGVAGLHRLLHRLPVLEDAKVVIAVAGMEGALVSVIGGLVACPVIGVPTSVGYGANFGGLAALLSMLNSCSSGVSVVNIDNGFGAGVLASKINRQSVTT